MLRLIVVLALATTPQHVTPAYAAGATRVWLDGAVLAVRMDVSGPVLSLASPDRRSTVRGRFLPGRVEHIVLSTSGALGRHSLTISPDANSELMWAPGSNAFFVTVNEGGLVGGYDLIAAGRFRGGYEVRKLGARVRRAYGASPCDDGEQVNVAGVGWLPNGHLIAAAEVPPHSACDFMGTFKAFEIDVGRGRVVGRWRQLEAKRRFSAMLGPRLQGSWDDCARDPSACVRPQGARGGAPLPKVLPKL